MKNMLIVLISLICVSGIGYLIIEYVRKDNKDKYHATAQCEKVELIYCKETFRKGISYSDFKKLLTKEMIEKSYEWKEGNTQLIELQNILKKCQISGRQYCGITFEFKKNNLTDIYSGYPCH